MWTQRRITEKSWKKTTCTQKKKYFTYLYMVNAFANLQTDYLFCTKLLQEKKIILFLQTNDKYKDG